MDMHINLSAEYRIDEFSLAQFKDNRFLPYPGNYLLLENAFQQEILGMDDLIYELQLKNFYPILAHPERYDYIDFLGSDMHNRQHAEILMDFIGSKDYNRLADRLRTRLLNDTEFPIA